MVEALRGYLRGVLAEEWAGGSEGMTMEVKGGSSYMRTAFSWNRGFFLRGILRNLFQSALL